jgi:predicted porin
MKVSNFNATLGFLSVGPDFRSIGSQSKDVNYNAQTVFYNRYTNAQVQRPVALIDLIGNENIYNRSISNSLMTPSQIYNTISPYGMATFNRQGAYVSVQYKSKQKIELNAEYQSSKEIRGQGSNSLREFSQTKVFAYLPLHEILGLKRHLSIQASNKMQTAKRNSQETIENVDLKMNQMSVGLKWEFSEGFELLGGFINQTNKGTDFIADRNAYSEVIYFYQNNLNLTQQIKAVGLRYNFSPKVYLAILYQQSTYKDQTKTNANFNMNQLGVIYSITL